MGGGRKSNRILRNKIVHDLHDRRNNCWHPPRHPRRPVCASKNVLGWVVVGKGAAALVFIDPSASCHPDPRRSHVDLYIFNPVGYRLCDLGHWRRAQKLPTLAALAWTGTRRSPDFVLDRVRHRRNDLSPLKWLDRKSRFDGWLAVYISVHEYSFSRASRSLHQRRANHEPGPLGSTFFLCRQGCGVDCPTSSQT